MLFHDDYCYKLIKDTYKDTRTKRSGVLYMNHIDKALILADYLRFDIQVQQAFCLHPLFQSDDALLGVEYAEFNIRELHQRVPNWIIILVMEYRNIANSYLSDKKIDDYSKINLSPLRQVNQMLILDKVQNRKDFELHQRSIFPCEPNPKYSEHRISGLNNYFNNWCKALGISEEKYQELKALIT